MYTVLNHTTCGAEADRGFEKGGKTNQSNEICKLMIFMTYLINVHSNFKVAMVENGGFSSFSGYTENAYEDE